MKHSKYPLCFSPLCLLESKWFEDKTMLHSYVILNSKTEIPGYVVYFDWLDTVLSSRNDIVSPGIHLNTSLSQIVDECDLSKARKISSQNITTTKSFSIFSIWFGVERLIFAVSCVLHGSEVRFILFVLAIGCHVRSPHTPFTYDKAIFTMRCMCKCRMSNVALVNGIFGVVLIPVIRIRINTNWQCHSARRHHRRCVLAFL